MISKLLYRAGIPVIATLAFSSVLSATVTGHLDTGICGTASGGGGVEVTATTIDWQLPVGGGFGCISTGVNTNVNYSGGSLGPGVQGQILDLNVSTTPLPVSGFMTFASAPGLFFDLTGLGPGPSSTVCTGLPLYGSCAAFSGSPFALQLTPTGTAVVLSAMGIARDGSGTTSNWSGAFTTQISGQTPAQVQSTINSGGSVRSTHSGDFIIEVNSQVPEPTTMSMFLMGGGLIAIATALRKKVRL